MKRQQQNTKDKINNNASVFFLNFFLLLNLSILLCVFIYSLISFYVRLNHYHNKKYNDNKNKKKRHAMTMTTQQLRHDHYEVVKRNIHSRFPTLLLSLWPAVMMIWNINTRSHTHALILHFKGNYKKRGKCMNETLGW